MAKVDDAIAVLSKMNNDEAAEIFKRFSTGNLKPFQRQLDSYAARASSGIERHFQEQVNELSSGLDGAIQERLDRLETTLHAKERQLKLSYHARRRTLEAGIPFELLDGYTFDDERQIDEKVISLAKAIADNDRTRVNKQLAGSYKPGAGISHDERPAVDTNESFQSIERRIMASL